MEIDVNALLSQGLRIGSQFLFEQIRASASTVEVERRRLVDMGGEPPLPSASLPGCPACALHREAAEARGLLEGLATKANEAGGIPLGLGGTIPLARDCYAKVRDHLRSVAISAPSLQTDCVALGRAAGNLEQQLTGQVAPENLGTIAAAARRLWWETYELDYAYFTLPAGGTIIEGDTHGHG